MNKPTNLNKFYNNLNAFGQVVYSQIRSLIHQADQDVCETLFVSNPYFYLKDYEEIKPHHRPSIMLVFYHDHVNIFAHAIKQFKSKLEIYKVTDKETLQIYYEKPLLNHVLIELFRRSMQPYKD